MSKQKRNNDRRIRVRSVRKEPPDLPKLARALIELARAQAEADAEAQHEAPSAPSKRRTQPEHGDAA